MNKLKISDKPLRRSWLRWLPYSAFGALLISWHMAKNIFGSSWRNLLKFFL
jgi:hypothetical protein